MLFNTKWLATLFNNNCGKMNEEVWISEVVTDSRKEMNQALFIPIVGENFDGHDYIDQAIENGTIALICKKELIKLTSLPVNFPVFFVEDTIVGLQLLASHYRQEINPIVIGITGSNGKTTTKDLVTSIVKTEYKTHATKGNFNNHIGLPLTILEMPKETEQLVLEMGMSNFGEIEQLSLIAKPDYGIITNIGESHIEYLGSRKGISRAKLEILRGMKASATLIIDGDETLLLENEYENNLITCGFNDHNNVMIQDIEILRNQTKFTLTDRISYTIPILGMHHAKNAAYAITLAKKLGISTDNIKKGLHSLEQTGMRFELLHGKNDVSIINDAYNASPTSMKAAINVIKQMDGFNEKVLILGDIFELGEHAESMHQTIAEVIEAPITVVLTYGNLAKVISEKVKQSHSAIICEHFNSETQLLKKLELYLKEDNLLLFKASRGMHFEKLVEAIKN